MGTYYHIGCLLCREWLFLGKFSERDNKKDKSLWIFLSQHILHNLRIVGDDSERDEDLIKTSEQGFHYWETDWKDFKELEAKKNG